MSDSPNTPVTEDEENIQTEKIAIRIHEWTTWLPGRPMGAGLVMSTGTTGLELFPGEKLMDVAVTATGKRQHISVADPEHPDDDKRRINVPHGLYAVQAIIAGRVRELPEELVPAHETPTPSPGPNRAQRRAGNNGNGESKVIRP